MVVKSNSRLVAQPCLKAGLSRRTLLAAGAATTAVALAPRARAQGRYPERAITLIVPASAASGPDASARKIAQRLAVVLAQPVIVANHPGVAGIPAADLAARAPADGYTLFFGGNASLCINPALYARLPYDPRKSFAPISMTTQGHPLFLIDPSLPIMTLADWISRAKAHPGELTFSSTGRGSLSHLAGELLKSIAGIDMLHVPYKEESHAITDVIAGNVHSTIAFGSAALSYVKAGKLRALCMAGPHRMPLLPGVPSAAEAGVPGFEAPGWLGVLAPAGTPSAIIDRVHDAIVGIVNEPDYRDWLHAFGSEAVGNTPAQFAEQIRIDLQRWAQVAKTANVHLD